MYLVAEIWRGKTRVGLTRLFSGPNDAYKYYMENPNLRRLWSIIPDSDSPMKPLTESDLKMMFGHLVTDKC